MRLGLFDPKGLNLWTYVAVAEYHNQTVKVNTLSEGLVVTCWGCKRRISEKVGRFYMKTCSDCGDAKELDAFAKNRNRPDGHASRCKDCLSKRAREGRKEGKFAKSKPPGGFKKPVRTEKTRAREAAGRALRKGTLRMPMNCEECRSPKKPDELQMHHHDYRQAQNVRFLCRTCHDKQRE